MMRIKCERKKFCNIGKKAYLVYERIVYECTYIHACQYVRICNVFLTNVNLTMYVPCTIRFKIPNFINNFIHSFRLTLSIKCHIVNA